jgi:hypothetical protein
LKSVTKADADSALSQQRIINGSGADLEEADQQLIATLLTGF